MISDRLLSSLDTVTHGFFTRRDGVSSGIFHSRNCGMGSSDDTRNVRKNRARVAKLLGLSAPERLLTVHQVHSPDAVRVNAPWGEGGGPKADAMVTDQPDIGLGILTADCAPVLFATRAGKPVIGAAHAGWRGAVGGVLENTINVMLQMGARREDIIGVVGPCIGRASYEVGPDFPQPFMDQDMETERFFSPSRRKGHHMFDLAGYVAWRLARTGIPDIRITGHDTLKEENLFFSYRRATLAGEPDYGRQISAIRLNPQ